jgi:hypothetical protein
MAKSKSNRRGNGRTSNNRSTKKPAAKSASTGSVPHRSATVEAKNVRNAVTTQAVAEAAYFLWQQRGGNEVVNWLEADSMLRRQTTQV